MILRALIVIASTMILLGLPPEVFAQTMMGTNHEDQLQIGRVKRAAQVPIAPIGVFGANQPRSHRFVLTLSSNYSRTDSNLIGTHYVSPNYIITNVASDRTPMSGSHLLRVVPLNGHAVGEFATVAYGVSGRIALVITGGWLVKHKDLETYKGLSGQTELGTSHPSTRGLSDTTIAGLYRIYQDSDNAVSVSFALGLPTGAYRNSWAPLSPAGTYVNKTAVYGMQEGSGTYTILPGIAYTGTAKSLAWGLSYRAVLPLASNADGWRFGNSQTASIWSGYKWASGLISTLRIGGTVQGRIRGQGSDILGYAEGNVPVFSGGRELDINLGATVPGRLLRIPKLLVQAEAGVPIYQNLNGPQAASQWTGALRVQYRF
jgi:hypothetical protein